MLARLRVWRAERRRKDRAVRRAVEAFQERRHFASMGGHVLRLDLDHSIVRVMYVTDHIPPTAPGSPCRRRMATRGSSGSRRWRTWKQPGAERVRCMAETAGHQCSRSGAACEGLPAAVG